MPIYLYTNDKTGETKEVFQTMLEEHRFSENGKEWRRIFTIPGGLADTKIDPFSEAQFADKVGNSKGSLGDAFDRSAEMSDKRASKIGGADPIKKDYFKRYAASRKGTKHPQDRPTEFTI